MMNTRPPVPEDDPTNPTTLTPSFLAIAEFIASFCGKFYAPFYQLLKKSDPQVKVPGCISGHMAFISFFLQDGLKGLADSWQTNDLADRYMDLIKDYKELGHAKHGGKEYFLEAPKKFIEEFASTIEKYFTQWRTSSLLPYVFAGDHPEVSSELAKWIVAGQETSLDEAPRIAFRDKAISFPFLMHEDAAAAPTTSLRRLMEYLVEAADVHEVMGHPLIADHAAVVERLAAGNGSITIHESSTYPDLTDDDDNDQYGGAPDFAAFSLMTLSRMACHPSNSQIAEFAVGESRKTHQQNRSEERRSVASSFKSLALGSINQAAVKVANENLKTKAEKDGKEFKKVDRPSGSTLMAPLLAARLKRIEEIDAAVEELPDGIIETIIKELKGSSNITKRKRDDMFSSLTATLQNPNKRRKTRNDAGGVIFISAVMGGEITISKLKKSENHEPHLLAELTERNVSHDEDNDSWNDLKKMLRNSEFGRLQQAGIRAFEKEDSVKTFVPQSDKMIELMDLG